jgi:HEAT repeat protein
MADDQKFISDLQSSSADVRFAAWRAAGEASPAVIPQAGKLAASTTPGIAKAAREALTTLTHAVGKEPAAPNRAGVVKGLLELTGAAYALDVRAHALRLLSGIAGEDAIPAIVKLMTSAELREEAVYCLERIPAQAAIAAIAASYAGAAAEFKPRILAALGHRRAAEGVPLCVEAMKSPNAELALAGLKAYGRIGRKPAVAPRIPDAKMLTPWQAAEHTDSLLRYADAQAGAGNAPEAMRIFKATLDRTEEHYQCAAVIGLAKLGTAEAAAAILPKLKSDNARVRITARQAWQLMAKA